MSNLDPEENIVKKTSQKQPRKTSLQLLFLYFLYAKPRMSRSIMDPDTPRNMPATLEKTRPNPG